MEEVERLENEYTTARAAVVEHLRSAAVGWYGDSPAEGPSTPLEKAWLDRHEELKAVAAEARTRANEGVDAFIRKQVAGRP